MKLSRSLLVAAGVALAAGAAQARDVFWSLGAQVAPGVSLGVGNTPPVVVAPAAPVFVTPAPVYSAPPVYYAPPRVVYSAPAYSPPVVYTAPPVYMRPARVQFVPPGHAKHRHKHRHKAHYQVRAW